MAHRFLLPGYGGQYTSETFAETDTAGADTIDCSNCQQLAIQVSSATPTGTFDIEQTFNGDDWAVLVNDLTLTDGYVLRLHEGDGPFGKLRINPTALTVGTASVTITGFRDF